MITKVKSLTQGYALAPVKIIACANCQPTPVAFYHMIKTAKEQLAVLINNYPQAPAQQVLAFFNACLNDEVFIQEISTHLKKGLSYQAAVTKVINQYIATLKAKDSAFSLAKINDLLDVKAYLLALNTGKIAPLKKAAILYFKQLTLSNFDLDTKYIKGLIVEDIFLESHLLILAQALNIPVIINTPLKLNNGEVVIMDTYKNILITNPTPEQLNTYQTIIANANVKAQQLATYQLKPTVMRDKNNLQLAVNVSRVSELKTNYNEGIGLIRTELLFKQDHSVSTQKRLYTALFRNATTYPPIIRLFDLASDKQLINYHLDDLTLRGVRIITHDAQLYYDQLVNIFSAYQIVKPAYPLHILIPYVSSISEVQAVKQMIATITAEPNFAKLAGQIKIGMMVEIPSTAMNIEAFLPLVDFFSVGTSDLISSLYQVKRTAFNTIKIDKAFINLLATLITKVKAGQKEIMVCGDFASTKEGLLTLISLGYTNFSLAPKLVGPMRQMLAQIDYHMVCSLKDLLLTAPDYQAVIKKHLKEYCNE